MKLAINVLIFMSLLNNSTMANEAYKLPNNIKTSYSANIDETISDEFNHSSLNTEKWARRKPGGVAITDYYKDDSLVKMECENESKQQNCYVSVKATSTNGVPKTAGIVSKATGYYGFYAVKFRYSGLDTEDAINNKTIWHPAIWSANTNSTDAKTKSVTKNGYWLEIDFVEWETDKHGWSSDAPARLVDSKGKKRKVKTKRPGLEKAIMKDKDAISDDRWQIVGLEYHPDYLKLWKFQNGKWHEYNDRPVNFVDHDPINPESQYTINTIGKKSATPGFWILGNVVSRYLYPSIYDGSNKKSMADMTFDIDYFRYYRHTSVIDANWPWEKQLPHGG